MLKIDRLTNLEGKPMAGFFVRNASGKVLAIGAWNLNRSFVKPTEKRYARDLSLCEALAKLTGCPVQWNIVWWCEHCSSGTRQELMRQVRQCRDRRHNHRIAA